MRKLFTIFIILTLLTLLVSAIAVFSLRWTIQTKDHVLSRYADVQLAIEELEASSQRRARKLRAFLLTGNPRFADERAVTSAEFKATLARVERFLVIPQEQRLLRAIEQAHAEILEVADELLEMRVRGVPQEEIESALMMQLQPLRDDADDLMASLILQVDRRNREETRRANRQVANASVLLGSTVSLAIISSFLLGLSLYRASRELLAEQEELARAARYQQEVMGIVSHDVRSPLSAIVATASLAQRVAGSPRERQRMERILRSARRIDGLATVLLDLTRMQAARRIPVVLQDADFHELVADQITEFRDSRRGTAIEHERIGNGRARFDGDRLGQAIAVLLQQAVDLAEAGSRVYVVSRGEGPAVSLEITISGPPVAGELLAQLFEPFGPVDAAPDEPVRLSRGFGLYLARELITAHTGTIDIRPRDDSGLAFRFHMPRVPRPAAPGAASLGGVED